MGLEAGVIIYSGVRAIITIGLAIVWPHVSLLSPNKWDTPGGSDKREWTFRSVLNGHSILFYHLCSHSSILKPAWWFACYVDDTTSFVHIETSQSFHGFVSSTCYNLIVLLAGSRNIVQGDSRLVGLDNKTFQIYKKMKLFILVGEW